MSSLISCPICSHTPGRLFAKDGYWICGCPRCQHQCAEVPDISRHVERVYTDDYFFNGGAGYPNYLNDGRLLEARGRWYARLLRKHTEPGRLLDVGAAAGFLLRGFERSGWEGMGIEPNPTLAGHARSLGLAVQTASLEDFRSADRFDLVCLTQVVAHFVDPRRALAAAARLTRPGGFWLVETWDRTSLTAKLLGRSWHEYSPPSVLHWFSPAGLRRLAKEFRLIQVAWGRPAKWISGAHAKALLQHKLGSSWLGRGSAKLLKALPDRLALPYPAEDLFWVIFQKR